LAVVKRPPIAPPLASIFVKPGSGARRATTIQQHATRAVSGTPPGAGKPVSQLRKKPGFAGLRAFALRPLRSGTCRPSAAWLLRTPPIPCARTGGGLRWTDRRALRGYFWLETLWSRVQEPTVPPSSNTTFRVLYRAPPSKGFAQTGTRNVERVVGFPVARRDASMSAVVKGSALRCALDPAVTKFQFNGGAEPRRAFRVALPIRAQGIRPMRHAKR
jgi:hypothetical protein